MGRAKITMKRIQNDRARQLAFMQRRKGLMKKTSEFSIKYGAESCLIVYDGDSNAEPVTWPQDHTSLNSILQKYEHQKIEMPLKKTFDLEDYFENKKNMVEVEISKVRKEINKIMYPTWDPCFSNMEEEQLRAFIAVLDAKIEACGQRISMLKNVQQSEASFNFKQNMAQESVSSSHTSQLNVMQQNIPQSGQQIHAPVKPLNEISEMVNFITHVEVPQDSTNQLGELVEWDDQLAEFEEWASQLVGLDDWTSQTDVFDLQDISFLSQYENENTCL